MDVLEVSCPTCGARKNQGCVYQVPKVELSPSTQWQFDRAGTPTQRPHTERYTKRYFAERKARRAEREQEYAQQNAASPDREAILRANAQAVQDEQHQLIAWLRDNVSILTG